MRSHLLVASIILSLLLVASAAAQLTVYVDDDGPTTDVILASDIVLTASAYADLPTTGFTRLFSEYPGPSGPEDFLLVVSNGEVWIVEIDRSASMRTALVRAVSELGIEAEYTEDVPEILAEYELRVETGEVAEPFAEPSDAWEGIEDANDPFGPTDETSDDREEQGAEPEPAACEEPETTYCDDGSVAEQCSCTESGLVCEQNSCPEHRSWWSAFVDRLFGWMRR